MVWLSNAGINPSAAPEEIFTHFSLPAFDSGEIPVVEPGGSIGSNKFLVPRHALLLSKLNPRIPRVWAPMDVPENSVCSTEFLVMVPKPGFDRAYLKSICGSDAFCAEMERHAIGTTGSHQRIQPNQALAIEVVVPSEVEEQSAIASFLSDMTNEIAALEVKRDKIAQLKQGMMQQLLTGRIRLI